MTAPAAGFIHLPDDSGNSGKKVQTQSETVGSDVVHAHYQVLRKQAKLVGVYRYGITQATVLLAVQNGTSTGFLFLVNPVGNSTRNIRVRRIWGTSQHSSAIVAPTAPRLLASRFTFTGVGSGTALTPDKVASAYGATSALLQAAGTGWTVALVAQIAAVALVGSLTGVGAYAPADVSLLDARDEDEYEVLAAGEGLVVWQDVAGTSSDTRKINLNAIWDEIDVS